MMPAVPTWLTFVRFIKNNWKIRVSSVHHVNTQPIWLQFGETSDVYLYLSQKASVKAWLKVVNHVMKLLVDYVNEDIKRVQVITPRSNFRVRLLEVLSLAYLTQRWKLRTPWWWKPGTYSKADPNIVCSSWWFPTLCIKILSYQHESYLVSKNLQVTGGLSKNWYWFTFKSGVKSI
jgi:hypothetical protein